MNKKQFIDRYIEQYQELFLYNSKAFNMAKIFPKYKKFEMSIKVVRKQVILVLSNWSWEKIKIATETWINLHLSWNSILTLEHN